MHIWLVWHHDVYYNTEYRFKEGLFELSVPMLYFESRN